MPAVPLIITVLYCTVLYLTAGAWAGQLVELLKRETQRPAALAALPVVPRKRCIFNVHCPRPQQQQPLPHTTSNDVTLGGEHTHMQRGRGGEDSERNRDGPGIPSPHCNSPLVVGPKGVYFRPEGAGGKYIAGISPAESEVTYLILPYLIL